jgi:molybdate transport system substrate-binding protein
MQGKGRYWQVPLDAYSPLEQGAVILKWAQDREAADAFRQFVTSPGGQDIMKRYGFGPPGN